MDGLASGRGSAVRAAADLPVLGLSRRDGDWVSKTDVTTYARCPYAYSLWVQGKISRDDMFDPFMRRLLDDGVAFEQSVGAALPPLAEADLKEALVAGTRVLNTPMYENDSLKLFGIPDGIEPAGGAMVPIEIKSHRKVQPLDEVELAFYWLLLEPTRTRRNTSPRGILLLRENGKPVEVDVQIGDHRFAQLDSLIADVRSARRDGVAPRVCSCRVCSSTQQAEVLAFTRAREDVTLLFGVGRAFAAALESIGVTSYRQLLERDPLDVVFQLRELDPPAYLSPTQVRHWQWHAEAHAASEAVFFGEPPPVDDSYVVLDLEYLNGMMGDRLWLAGVETVQGNQREVAQFWASDDDASERRLLERLQGFLDVHRELPVVTWSGLGADLPVLRKAANRLDVPDPMAEMTHLDLFQYAVRSIRLPIPTLGLKELASYFGVPYIGPVTSGFETQFLYRQFQNTRSKRRATELQNDLLAYNRQDLDNLICVLEEFRRLAEFADAQKPLALPDANTTGMVATTVTWRLPDGTEQELQLTPELGTDLWRGSRGP
jgi:predicted RecB family nuclease